MKTRGKNSNVNIKTVFFYYQIKVDKNGKVDFKALLRSS